MRVGECFQFEAAACAVHQHAPLWRDALRQQHDRHAMQAIEARHLTRRSLGIDARMIGTERGVGIVWHDDLTEVAPDRLARS